VQDEQRSRCGERITAWELHQAASERALRRGTEAIGL
jgi:hypothetical protein